MTASSAAISPAVFKSGAAVEDGNGNLFFTDVTNGRILERSDLGVYSQVATLPVSATSGIAMDGTGTLYVSAGSSVYAFMPGSTPQVLPMPSSITLGSPAGLAIDLAQDLYIADNTRNVIYQIPLGSSTGATLTITGPGVPFLGPAGLDVDASNNLYIADSGHDRIVEVPLSSLSSTVLTLSSLTLSNPTGVAVDAAGTVYIANTGGGNVIESTVTGSQFILTETSNTSAPHPLPTVTPTGIVIQPSGDLVISDTTQGLIDVARSAPAVNFPTPTVVGTLDSTDDPETLTVQSSGNITADLALSPTTTNPSISTNAFLLATTGNCPILAAGAALTPADSFVPGEVCTYDINFKPTVVGLNSANLILATTAAKGVLTASTTVPLTGIGLSTIKSFKLVAIPSTINKGGTVQLILTALNADGTTVATDYVGTVTFTTTDSTGLFQFGTSLSTNTTTYTFTAADNGVLNVTPGLQLNQYGVYTASATDGTYSATSNNIYVIEPTTLTLTSSINPSLVNQSTTFTLNVATSGGLAPTGAVTFYSNGVQIGSPVTLSAGGTASINDSFPAAGNYAITATFTPSNSTQGGTASLTQVVGLPTAVVLTSSINPSLVNQSTNLTATISAIALPTGSVTFYNGATALGTVTRDRHNSHPARQLRHRRNLPPHRGLHHHQHQPRRHHRHLAHPRPGCPEHLEPHLHQFGQSLPAQPVDNPHRQPDRARLPHRHNPVLRRSHPHRHRKRLRPNRQPLRQLRHTGYPPPQGRLLRQHPHREHNRDTRSSRPQLLDCQPHQLRQPLARRPVHDPHRQPHRLRHSHRHHEVL